MLHRLRAILSKRLELDKPQADLNDKLLEWHETLKDCDSKYTFTDFVTRAFMLPEDHPNLDLINRAVDLLDCLNKAETALPVVKVNKLRDYMQ